MLIAQISDTHVRPEGELYKGRVDSNGRLAQAVAHVTAIVPAIDLVLLTGDLAEMGTDAEYAMLRKLIAPLSCPVLVIPGNHDERAAMKRGFADHHYLPADGPMHYVAGDLGPLRIVALDITVPGATHGEADDASARWLDAALAAEPQRPTVVMMHQPPILSGVPFLDGVRCRNGEKIEAVVARHKQVERIVCGHVHRFMQASFGGAILVTAPSTMSGFPLEMTGKEKPGWQVVPPACLLHHWSEDAGLTTHYSPIGTFSGPFPFR
jgi:3',5'-cyclic AMP phosphodiesterase CpdA